MSAFFNYLERKFQLQPHPFRLLLYLEWVLMGIALLNQSPMGKGFHHAPPPPSPHSLISFSPPITLCLLAFGLMGLRLPSGKLTYKLLYTGLELGLIWLAFALSDWRMQPIFAYLIVVIRSCLIFQPIGRLIVASLVYVAFLAAHISVMQDVYFAHSPITFPLGKVPPALPPPEPKPFPHPPPLDADQIKIMLLSQLIKNALLVGLVLVFLLLLVNALLSERKSREVLAIAHNQLRQYALRIENQATLQERNRIAREIHDSLGHTLTAQSIQLENALLSCSSNAEEMKTYLVQAKQLGSEALQEVRQSVAALRSNPLQGKNLKEAIATMLENFRSMTNAQLNYEVQLSQPISVEVGTAIYRILQEALTNIYKHSMASSVTIQIFTRANQLSLVIEDNGVGFDPAQNTTGFGLQAMRERTVALGGNFYLTSEPERGCLVRAIVPIQASLPEVTDMSYEL